MSQEQKPNEELRNANAIAVSLARTSMIHGINSMQGLTHSNGLIEEALAMAEIFHKHTIAAFDEIDESLESTNPLAMLTAMLTVVKHLDKELWVASADDAKVRAEMKEGLDDLLQDFPSEGGEAT